MFFNTIDLNFASVEIPVNDASQFIYVSDVKPLKLMLLYISFQTQAYMLIMCSTRLIKTTMEQ